MRGFPMISEVKKSAAIAAQQKLIDPVSSRSRASQRDSVRMRIRVVHVFW
jgi:hypothetical protein